MNLEDLKDFMNLNITATAEKFVLEMEYFIDSMMASGVSTKEIRLALSRDLKESGRIFGALKNGAKSGISNGVEQTANIRSNEIMEGAGVERLMWISSGVNVCIDCRDRAGRTGTMEFFDLIGQPKSGFSVCRDNCNCTLVPIEYDKEGEFVQLKRGQKIK